MFNTWVYFFAQVFFLILERVLGAEGLLFTSRVILAVWWRGQTHFTLLEPLDSTNLSFCLSVADNKKKLTCCYHGDGWICNAPNISNVWIWVLLGSNPTCRSFHCAVIINIAHFNSIVFTYTHEKGKILYYIIGKEKYYPNSTEFTWSKA